MTFIFNTTIPAAANNPSDDQPKMLTNNISTDGILAVDHIGFNAANGGNHLQVHLPQYTSPSVVNGTATQGSVVYSAAGTADAAHAQLLFKTAQNAGALVLPLSTVRAWGYASGAVASPGNSIINNQSSNVVSVVRTTNPGIFTVTLTANATTTADYAVLLSNTGAVSSAAVIGTYAITGINTFVIQFRNTSTENLVNPTSFSFQVMQI